MNLKKAFWSYVKYVLRRYKQGNKNIARCYIRHSAAFGPRNPVFSDIDLTFFVNAHDLQQLKQLRLQIKADLDRHPVLGRITEDVMVLPDTKNSYQLCEESYPFKFKYPFSSWLSVEAQEPAAEVPSQVRSPLDHCPEFFLYSYMVPVARELKKRHCFEKELIHRKLIRDAAWAGFPFAPKSHLSFDEALLTQMDIWDHFYKKIKVEDNAVENRVYRCNPCDLSVFLRCWEKMADRIDHTQAVSGLWVHPAYHDDAIYNVTLNLKQGISPQMGTRAIGAVIGAFSGLKYNLFLGTEDAMIGRINGLRGPFLLDPWRFKHEGICLCGDPTVKEKIVEPSRETLKKKYRESLLALMYSRRFIEQGPYLSYAMYRLFFTMDHFFNNNEMILNDEELKKIYADEFIPKKNFNAKEHLPGFLLLLKKRHDFDIWGS